MKTYYAISLLYIMLFCIQLFVNTTQNDEALTCISKNEVNATINVSPNQCIDLVAGAATTKRSVLLLLTVQLALYYVPKTIWVWFDHRINLLLCMAVTGHNTSLSFMAHSYKIDKLAITLPMVYRMFRLMRRHASGGTNTTTTTDQLDAAAAVSSTEHKPRLKQLQRDFVRPTDHCAGIYQKFATIQYVVTFVNLHLVLLLMSFIVLVIQFLVFEYAFGRKFIAFGLTAFSTTHLWPTVNELVQQLISLGAGTLHFNYEKLERLMVDYGNQPFPTLVACHINTTTTYYCHNATNVLLNWNFIFFWFWITIFMVLFAVLFIYHAYTVLRMDNMYLRLRAAFLNNHKQHADHGVCDLTLFDHKIGGGVSNGGGGGTFDDNDSNGGSTPPSSTTSTRRHKFYGGAGTNDDEDIGGSSITLPPRMKSMLWSNLLAGAAKPLVKILTPSTASLQSISDDGVSSRGSGINLNSTNKYTVYRPTIHPIGTQTKRHKPLDNDDGVAAASGPERRNQQSQFEITVQLNDNDDLVTATPNKNVYFQ